jgi:protein-S-isoprenylcysteine O-methyltransferase Ste14
LVTAFTLALAGRVDYWQGWLYNGLNFIVLATTYVALSNRKDLIQERLKPGKGMKKWDKGYYIISTPMYFLAIAVASLDAGRFGWNPRVPLSIVIVGLAVCAAGHLILLWAKWTNKFFATVVRIQIDRGQTVCKDGPYRVVRHPGYVGGILFGLATPLVLGSFWGLIPAAIAATLLVIRTHLEDRTLKEELPGYTEYTKEVRYRLIPRIW